MSVREIINDEKFLASATLFKNVAPEAIEHYVEECSIIEAATGDVLLKPGVENTHLYVIVSGEFEVRLNSLERAALTTLGSGDSVGEMSMIESNTPSAFVVAGTDCKILAIPHDVLWAMVGASHAVARNLLVILSGRLRTDNAIIADSAVIIRHFQKKSYTDSLTGLYNRRWMEEFFAREIKRCQLEKCDAVLAVIDIDNFRAFNNSFGHLVGDQALSVVTNVLIRRFRSDDLVARYGGDEFVVLLSATALKEAYDIAERVRLSITEASQELSVMVPECADISVSIGIAAMEPEDTLTSLLSKADAALYRAKKSGRNQVSN